jgi:membrane carboxypeptidase/penicillin-binding protein PbpC
VGNADYSAMENITGLTGAAPIWSKFMQYAVNEYSGGNYSTFYKPCGFIDRVICSVSGTEPSQWCPSQRSEYFTNDQLPLPSNEDLWTKVVFDTWTGLRASNNCQNFTKDEFALNVTDPWAIGWLQNNPEGKAWVEEMGLDEPIKFSPPRACDANDSHPTIEISVPGEGQIITASPMEITGKIDVSADFRDFRVEYGTGDDPAEWNELFVSNQPINQPGKIYSWDINPLPPGLITLKITMANIRGGYAERRIHLNIQVATPTPTVTPTPT